jgi:hypothetical protein
MKIDIITIREQLDIITAKCGRSQFPKNKCNYLTQQVAREEKEHVAQEPKKTKSNLQVKHVDEKE